MNRARVSAVQALLLTVFFGFSAGSWAWTKTYVVEWIEPGNYFDPYDPEAFSAESKGRDCPNGVTPDPDYPKKLIDVGHSPESVQHLYDPEVRNAPGFDRSVFANRGRNGEDVYREPWHAIEYDYPLVEGKLAYGFDLDNNPETGFTGLDGTPGVDNNLYKVSGCIGYYRGRQKDSGGFKYSNESMHNGSFTLLLVLEGKQDPMNDTEATLSFKASPDKLVRDAMGGIASDYSFRVEGDSTFESTVPVTIKDGLVVSNASQDIVFRNRGSRRGVGGRPMVLYNGQLKFSITQEGKLEGMVGGYQDWEPIWRGRANYIVELVAKVDSPSFWYQLKRHADGVPDPKSGEMTAISSVYNVWAVPAFAVEDIQLTSND